MCSVWSSYGEFFFLPCQPIFDVVLPLNDAKKKWLNAVNKTKSVILFSKEVQKTTTQTELHNILQEKLLRMKICNLICNENKTITLYSDTLETIQNDERQQNLNRDWYLL